jgi:hypothetical protein
MKLETNFSNIGRKKLNALLALVMKKKEKITNI